MYELISKRTRNSKHFDIGNGQIQAVIQKSIHYFETSTGTFEDFNGNWIFEKDFGWKVKKADHNLRIFTQNPNKKWLRVGLKNGVFVEYNFPNIEPVYNGNSVLFSDAWENTDIHLTAFPEGIKNDIVLKTTGHPSSFSFPIQTTGCTIQFEFNSLVFYSSGNIIGKIPAPYMEDANGKIGKVTLDYDGNNVRFIPDSIWLASAVYPVTIDPTTTTIQPDNIIGQDAFISNLDDNTNGSVTWLPIGNGGGAGARTYVKIPLTGIPQGSSITLANLGFYAYYTDVTRNYNVYEVLGIWDESTLTRLNWPSLSASPVNTLSIPGSPVGWAQTDITILAQQWLNTGINYGVALKASPDIVNTYRNVYSSESTADITLRPKLTVTYTAGGTNATVNAVTATTQAQAISPIVSASVNITSPIMNTNSNALIPTITAENNYKKSPIYKWKELLQNYTFQEQKQKYKIKELPSVYSWKELK